MNETKTNNGWGAFQNKKKEIEKLKKQLVVNSLNNYEHPICIALAGRVPVKVRGKIRKGDMLVSSLHGCATATDNPTVGTVIGKALQNYDSTEEGTIEVMIGRN